MLKTRDYCDMLTATCIVQYMPDVCLIRQLLSFDPEGFVTEQMEHISMYLLFVLLLQGDSGSPLTALYCPRRLVGILCQGPSDCRHPAYPAIYTNISAVHDCIIHNRQYNAIEYTGNKRSLNYYKISSATTVHCALGMHQLASCDAKIYQPVNYA